ncbi:MAG: PAS domain-containing protein [Alphaproteobacteria bacterium]|nr:PAS domain-containing protein [Alphaproteobacteria bacterium]
MIGIDLDHTLLDEAPNCLALSDAWKRWRRDRGIPTLNDVKPEYLGKAIPALSVLNLDGLEDVRFSLHGGTHRELAGKNLKGHSLVDLIRDEDRERFFQWLRHFIEYPCGVLASATVDHESGNRTAVRTLTLPVKRESHLPPQKAYLALDHFANPKAWRDDTIRSVSLPREYRYVDLGFGTP